MKVSQFHSPQSVQVCKGVEFSDESIHQHLPRSAAELAGSHLEALGSVVATQPQHISHCIPKLRSTVELHRFIVNRHSRPAKSYIKIILQSSN